MVKTTGQKIYAFTDSANGVAYVWANGDDVNDEARRQIEENVKTKSVDGWMLDEIKGLKVMDNFGIRPNMLLKLKAAKEIVFYDEPVRLTVDGQDWSEHLTHH